MPCFQVAIIISTKTSARASRLHIKVVLEGEEVKIIISRGLLFYIEREHQHIALFSDRYVTKKKSARALRSHS